MAINVKCSIENCNHPIQSLDVLPEKALIEILVLTSAHVKEKHSKHWKVMESDIMRLMEGVGFYMLVTSFLDIPATETILLDKISEFEISLLEMLEFEAIQEEGEDEPKLKRKVKGGEEITTKTGKKDSLIIQ